MQQPIAPPNVELPALTRALEASWDHLTSYMGETRPDNPAYGQCYPTSRVVQWFYPEYEIVKGDVWTGASVEQHFWNVRGQDANAEWLDLSWKHFQSDRPYDILPFWTATRWATASERGQGARCCWTECWPISPRTRFSLAAETNDRSPPLAVVGDRR